MFGFRSFIVEYITDEQRAAYSKYKMKDSARSATDHFFGKGVDKIHGEIEGEDKSETHRRIEQHLGHEVARDDYMKGTVKDKYGRDVRIGRVIKDQSLRDEFSRDPVRATGYRNHKTTTVRGIEAAGQTNPAPNEQHPTGHAWKNDSCKNIKNGIRRRFLPHEIKNGTVVHFVHDQNGQEIYRATLQPHQNKQGDTAYKVDSEYGIAHPKFTQDAHRIAAKLSGEYKSGVFKKNPEVYDDSNQQVALHPKTSKKHIDDMVNNIDSHPHDVQKVIAEHPQFTSNHLTKILKTGSASSKATILSRVDPNKITSAHVTSALRDENPDVRAASIRSPHNTEQHLVTAVKTGAAVQAIHHPNATDKVYTAGLNHSNPQVVATALRRYAAASPKDIDKVLSRPDVVNHDGAAYAVRHHPATLPRHIDKIVSDSTSGYNIANILHHPSVTSQTVAKAFSREGHSMSPAREAAVVHDKATPEIITAAKNDESKYVRKAAYNRPDTTSAELHRAFDKESSGDSDVRETLVSHKNADPALLTKALSVKGGHWINRLRVGEAALKHRKIDNSHIALALNSDDAGIRESAVKHRKATQDQIVHTYKNDPADRVRMAALSRLKKIHGDQFYGQTMNRYS